MKSILFASLVVLALAAGCSSDKKAAADSKDSLANIAPPPQPKAETETGPVVVETDKPKIVEQAPAVGPNAGAKYTVKKGDTLWSLAQKTYGDGKQYKKIAAANPSTIKNDRLIAGTTITLP